MVDSGVRSIRRRARLETIVAAAGAAFRDRGFHTVTLEEIGRTCGVSGPALYRYFPTKQHILFAVFESFEDRYEAAETQASSSAPRAAVECLVKNSVDMAVKNGGVYPVLWFTQREYLLDDHRRAVRARQLQHLEFWVRSLSRMRPELTYAEARTLVHCALGVISSAVLFEAAITPEALGALLTRQALTILTDQAFSTNALADTGEQL